MGEIADMMLDGTLCQGCGVYLGGDGYPGYCSGCQRDYDKDARDAHTVIIASHKKGNIPKYPEAPKVACPCCSKMVKVTGIGEHWKFVHSKQVSA